jgi:nitroreductase
MNVTEAVERRMSVRAFRPDPVPGAVVREILEKARHAPSGGNVQPWKIYALAGQSLTEFKSLVAERAAAARRKPRSTTSIRPSCGSLTAPIASSAGKTCTARSIFLAKTRPPVANSSREISHSSALPWVCSSFWNAEWDLRSGRTSACTCRPRCSLRWNTASIPVPRNSGLCGQRPWRTSWARPQIKCCLQACP